jgi:hypothetical protein
MSKTVSFIATNLVRGVIERGSHLKCDAAMIVGCKDNSEVANRFTVYQCSDKDNTNKFSLVHEGVDASNAAAYYVNLVGDLAAIGHATNWMRQKQTNVETKSNFNYDAAVKELEDLWGRELVPGSKEWNRFNDLAHLIDEWEEKNISSKWR